MSDVAVRGIDVHTYLVKDVNDLARVLHEAFYVARTGRPGPVVVDLPKDVLFATGTYRAPETVEQRKSSRPQTEPDPARIAGTVRDLSHGGAAITVFGRGGDSGDHGPIMLDRHGGAQTRVDVRATDHEGTLHVSFSAIEPAFEPALRTLSEAPRTAQRA